MQIYVNGAKKVLQFEGQPLTHDGAVVLSGRDRDVDRKRSAGRRLRRIRCTDGLCVKR